MIFDFSAVCGHSLLNVTETPQTLVSPNYPHPYPANVKCTYVFKSTETSSLRLHFVDFELTNEERPTQMRHECTGDTITLIGDINNNYLDTDLGPSTVYSKGLSNLLVRYGFKKLFCTEYENIHFIIKCIYF